jgi:hypothetical protein
MNTSARSHISVTLFSGAPEKSAQVRQKKLEKLAS